ncbi:MAG: pilus assembly protein N-terminal domain-containing protein [Verrucomicrobiia bacterium]
MNFFTCLFTPALVAATLLAANPGMAAEPAAQANAPTASKPLRLPASDTNVVAAIRPLAQTNAPSASKAPISPVSGSDAIVTSKPAAQTNAPSARKAPVPVAARSNIVVVTTPVAQTTVPVISVTQRLPVSVSAITAAATQLVQTNMLTVGEARLLAASGSNIVVPVEDVVRVIPAGPGKVVVSAEQEGHTDMMVLDDDSKITEHYTIIVTKKQHTAEKLTYEASLEDFRQVVKKMVGDHQVSFDMLVGPRISFNGTNLVAQPHPVLFIHGEAKDEIEANTIRSVASRFYGQGDFGSTSQQVSSVPSVNPNGSTATNTVQITNLQNDPNIVDQMTIRTHHQVRIRIQVAEVNITAAKQKGIRYSDSFSYGIGGFAQQLNGLNFKPSTLAGMMAPGAADFGSGTTVPASFRATLQLLISDGYARLLSEPTLVTKSGQEASFLAGGSIIQAIAGTGVATTQLIPFGVRMNIKPIVDRADHIDAEVYTEVSDVPATLDNTGGQIGILSRTSTVKLRLNNHDTLILGGLLQNNFRNTIHKLPWIGQVPILGALFRSKDWNSGQTELLFFVTPEIIGEDLKADTERNVATPAMRQWHNADSHKDILSDPKSHARPDNDLHDLLGLPPDRMHDEQLKQAPVVPDTAPMRGASQ